MPVVTLPEKAPAREIIVSTAATGAPSLRSAQPGKFISAFNYTGPAAAVVRVKIDAQNGKKIYGDRDYAFANLPASLAGADWAQLADADQRYSAVDLIELAVSADTVVSVAHDDRAPLPQWLTQQFQPTNLILTVHDQPMKIFQRHIVHAGSLTLGSNTEGTPVRANMYVVLVNTAVAP